MHPRIPVINGQKPCTKCGVLQDLAQYSRFKHGCGGIKSWCKACSMAYEMRRRQKPSIKPRVQEYMKAYRIKNGAEMRRRARENYRKNGSGNRFNRIRNTFGLSREDYEGMITSQKNCCAICRTPFSTSTPHVDHCHTTGMVRGLLCPLCNYGLGSFRDTPAFMSSAIEYLNQHAPGAICHPIQPK